MTRTLIHSRDHAAHGVPSVSELGPGAQLVLCAARSWHAGEVKGAASPCALFRCAGMASDAFAAFASLLSLLSACPSAPGFGALHDASLTDGEEGLLSALAALQEGEPWRAQRVVADWGPPAAAPRAIGLLAVIARCFAGAGLPLSTQPLHPVLH